MILGVGRCGREHPTLRLFAESIGWFSWNVVGERRALSRLTHDNPLPLPFVRAHPVELPTSRTRSRELKQLVVLRLS